MSDGKSGKILRERYKKQTGKRFVNENYLSDKRLEKRSEIVHFKMNNPESTLQEIGKQFDLTRERIRQILISEGFVTRRKLKTKACSYCGTSFVILHRQQSGKSDSYCKDECKTDAHKIYLNCKTCEKQYVLLASAYRGRQRYRDHGRNYCSVKCRTVGASKELRRASDAGKGMGYDWGIGRSKDGLSLKEKKAIASECNISLSYLYHMIMGRHFWRVDAYEAYMRAKEQIK